MTEQQLQDNMRRQLEIFNDEKVKLTDDTVHDQVLAPDDARIKSRCSMNVYRNAISWILDRQKLKQKWPGDWMTLSVKELAAKLLLPILLLLASLTAQSQLSLTLGAAKTELRDNALIVILKYVQSFDSIWRQSNYVKSGKNSMFSIAPQADIVTGNQDAFSSITIKATGTLMTFKTTTVSGIEAPDLHKLFHIFPISVGGETNNLFNNINGILEVGWVPYYQQVTSSIPEFLKATEIGVFLQAGYKFKNDTTGNTTMGGEIDQSLEAPNRGIARVKGVFGIDTRTLFTINGLAVGLAGSASVWYDFLNGAVYHKLDAIGRFYISSDNSIDFIYQKGSGAPNFNQGDQYGIGLTITF